MRILISFTMISLPSFKTKGLRKYIKKYPGGAYFLGCVYIVISIIIAVMLIYALYTGGDRISMYFAIELW